MRRVMLAMLMLLSASLACSLTSANKEPTPAPVSNPVIQFPTATPTVGANAPGFVTATSTTAVVINPPCSPRTDWPTYLVVAGDTLSGIALRSGTTVEVLVVANCLADAGTIIAGQSLRVPRVPAPLPTNTPNVACAFQWFFTFKQGERDTLKACPGPVSIAQASGQDFEGGRVYRYAPLPGSTDTRGTIYVVYNDGTWETYVDTWDSTQPTNDPALVPPAGRYQPVEAIGKVWRDFPSVRNRLGWAYEPAALFSGRFQQPVATNVNYWYIDHGKWSLVLRMVSVNNGPNTWTVVGGY